MIKFQPKSVRRLIDDLGESLTYTTYALASGDGYNPVTGAYSRTGTNHTVKGYYSNFKIDEIDGNSVVVGDRKLYLHTLDTSYETIPEPEAGDTISGNGGTARIVRVQSVFSAGEVMCYICHLRE